MVNMYQDKEIIEKTKELVKTIKEDSLYKEYMELRHELKANKEINDKIIDTIANVISKFNAPITRLFAGSVSCSFLVR